MLGSSDIVAFVPSRSPKKSRSFYEHTLGLGFVSDDQFGPQDDGHRNADSLLHSTG
jgi:catechol 2,3-dioxygenase-like lactoylglutathione lyase family enzyme